MTADLGIAAALRRAGPGDIAGLVALQHAAYARNRAILGVEPLPLLADYADLLRDSEVWLAGPEGEPPRGALVLQWRAHDLLVWSVAAHPDAQGQGLGALLLAHAETRARQERRDTIRLYTGEKLADNIAWYRRHGYAIERREALTDRVVVHLVKTVETAP